MRISTQTLRMVNAYAKQKSSGAAQAEKKNAASVQKDEIVLSKPAQDFQQILQKAKDGAAVRQERVSQLSAAVEDGSYRVDARLLAEKMLQFRY